MLTDFGRELRLFRVQNNQLLYNMANDLGVSSAYLSAIENGRKPVTDEIMSKLKSTYNFTEKQWTALIGCKEKLEDKNV